MSNNENDQKGDCNACPEKGNQIQDTHTIQLRNHTKNQINTAMRAMHAKVIMNIKYVSIPL